MCNPHRVQDELIGNDVCAELANAVAAERELFKGNAGLSCQVVTIETNGRLGGSAHVSARILDRAKKLEDFLVVGWCNTHGFGGELDKVMMNRGV